MRRWAAWLALGRCYYRHRVYHAQLGRFVSRDPAGYEDDVILYVYVANLPIDRTDPMGLQKWWQIPIIPPGIPPIAPPEPEPIPTPAPPPAPGKGDKEFKPVPIPENDEGCSGWCFYVAKSKVVDATIDSYEWKEIGGGCPNLLKTTATNTLIVMQIKNKISPATAFAENTCSKGCECRDKQHYDGQKIALALEGQAIMLDPKDFLWPLNAFKKGECFIQVHGKAKLQVDKGWLGRCCKIK